MNWCVALDNQEITPEKKFKYSRDENKIHTSEKLLERFEIKSNFNIDDKVKENKLRQYEIVQS